MGPVIHCSVGDISLFPRTTFIPRKDIQLTKYNVSGRYTRLSSYSQRLLLPQSSLRLFQFYRSGCGSEHGSRFQILAAIGTDVTIEEQNPAVSGEDADETLGSPPNSVETSETAPADPAATTTARSQRSRPMRKSEMPPVKDEELISGASFTGKVRSIQPFGAFVDIGAYTEGLVHVSRMSDGYVKDVSAVVSVGQEVKVRIVEANKESGRISLTMRDSDDPKTQQRKEAPTSGSSDKPRPVGKNAARPNQRRDPVQKRSKFVKGQVLDGTVKNITRSGAFVSLPDGEEGFLPVSEESEGFGAILGNTSLQIGQEVNVRVLRFSRGKVTLTMKKEEDAAGLNVQLNQGVVHVATNPFELAFRKNKDIAGFLEERERVQKASENLSIPKTSEQIGEKVSDAMAKSVALEVDASTVNSNENQVNISSASGVVLEEEEITSKGLHEEISAAVSTELVSNEEEPVSSSPQNANIVLESLPEDEDSSRTFTESSSSLGLDEVSIPNDEKDSSAAIETVEEQFGSSEAVISEDESSANGSSTSLGTDEASTTYGDKEAGEDIKAVEENVEVLISESSVSNQVSVTDEVNESNVITITEVETSSENLSTETIGPPAESIEVTDSVKVEESNFDTRSSDKIDEQILSPKGEVPKEVASSQSDGILVNDEVVTEPPLLLENEMPSSDSKDVKVKAPEESNAQTAFHEQGGAMKATISPTLVKQLREESGAGMMDCKKALAETGGDIVKAQEFLRKKGLASADKKASRATAEGRVGSYIHDNRIGVLIEVNCETDFVSRGEIFKQLVDDLAMQVAACPQVRYLATEDVPEEVVNKEREIEMQKEDLLSKPEQMRSKIVDGRIRKRLEEFALLEQPYIKNDKMVVKDLVKQTIATIGENIKVKRFARYNLGEGLEKKSQDFAAEVAAQTAAKPSPAVAAPKDQSAETKETVEIPPTIAVSAALVKQLREETGAGMMDCKKALTETGGDLEKAQEYLRKKGLSSADKKSSRLAAEGRISSYIHDSRIGVLIEVNSETDFVARNEKFKELVDDLAMQVVACPQVEFVSVEDIPENVVSKEKELEMQREDLKSKPENIREKIVEGRISKRLGDLALLEQPFIKDDSVMVKDLVKQTVAALGENIRVRRFVRYTLGESKD